MRGIMLGVVFFGALPFVFRRPFVGVLLWFWMSIMNPHRIVYGLFSELPYALIIGVVTLLAWVTSREAKRPPIDTTTVLLFCLLIWITITSVFGLAPGADIYDRWQLAAKMLGFTLLAYSMMTTRVRVEAVVWIVALSIGFYGLRGAIFTLLHGGGDRIWGPPESMIADNNELGVALNMALPLLIFGFERVADRRLRVAMLCVAAATFLSTIFTYSRGAFLTISAVAAILWLKSRHKLIIAFATVVAAVLIWNFAPQQWSARMSTIQTYQKDQSAESRLYFWRLATAMAEHRPLVGGGFHWNRYPAIVNSELADSGLPALTRPRATHSIYFEMLGNHGFIGLGLFVSLILVTFLNARWTAKYTAHSPELAWANSLGRMLQLSLLAYCIGGAFVSLGMYDGFYVLAIVAAATRRVVLTEINADPSVVGRLPRASELAESSVYATTDPPVTLARSKLVRAHEQFRRATE